MEPDAMKLVFWMLSFKPAFHSLLLPSSRGSLVLHFLPLEWYHLPIWSWRFLLAILIPARWRSGKEFVGQCRRLRRRGFDPWVRKILWNRKSQPTPVFLPGKFHGQRSLVGYSPWGCKESDLTAPLSTHTNRYFIPRELRIRKFLFIHEMFNIIFSMSRFLTDIILPYPFLSQQNIGLFKWLVCCLLFSH